MLQVCKICGAERAKKLILDLGAGNSFLGGLAAGLTFSEGDVYEGEPNDVGKKTQIKEPLR